ncbi:hypothetical protein OO25_14505 [Phaeobacter sp. S60]|nr:hypothetical protein OO25_14505 [Phaeobacter sp. S60]
MAGNWLPKAHSQTQRRGLCPAGCVLFCYLMVPLRLWPTIEGGGAAGVCGTGSLPCEDNIIVLPDCHAGALVIGAGGVRPGG